MGAEPQDNRLLNNRLKLYEAIVNNSNDGVLVFNDQMKVMFANKKAGKILLEKPSQLRGRPLSDLIPPEKRAKHDKLVTHFRISKMNQQEMPDWRGIECCRMNGKTFPANVTINKFYIGENCVFIANLSDMTEFNEVEKKKNRAELENFANAQQKTYLIKTLKLRLEKNITQIARTAQIIKENYTLKPVQDAMSSIMQNAFSTMSYSQKVIYIADVMNDPANLKLVDRTLAGTFDRLRSIIETQNVKEQVISWNIPATAAQIQLKKETIVEQLFYNIFDDALSYVKTGQIKVEIDQFELKEDGFLDLQFHLKNSHFGVPQKVMDLILAPQADPKLARAHHVYLDGLCLRLAKALASELGGKMRVISHPIEGTDIFIKLCLEAEQNDQKHVKESEASESEVMPTEDTSQNTLKMDLQDQEAELKQDTLNQKINSSEEAAGEKGEDVQTLPLDPSQAQARRSA